MDAELSEKTIQAATHCRKGKICLENQGGAACKVVRLASKTLHYISVDSDPCCPYNRSFGCYRHCTCPVRKALFAKYKK
jgi:hypothetical protein